MKPLRPLVLLLTLILTANAANLKLTWDPNPAADEVTGYRVYFRNNAFLGGQFGTIAAVATNTWTWTNVPLGNFSFYITATNAAGESTPSAIVTTNITAGVVVVPGAPRNLVAQLIR